MKMSTVPIGYGAQGISYYVYSFPGHTPGITTADGKPTSVYHWLKVLNREFAGIAVEVQPLRSLNVYHVGMMPPGAEPLPKDAAFTVHPPVPAMDFKPGQRVKGVLPGTFGPQVKGAAQPTHVFVVNLDYQAKPQMEKYLSFATAGEVDVEEGHHCVAD